MWCGESYAIFCDFFEERSVSVGGLYPLIKTLVINYYFAKKEKMEFFDKVYKYMFEKSCKYVKIKDKRKIYVLN